MVMKVLLGGLTDRVSVEGQMLVSEARIDS